MPGSALAPFFHSPQHGMRGVLPFRPGWHARRSHVPPSAAYAAVFRSVWCGPVCAAVFGSARHDIYGGVPFCPARHMR